MEKIVLEEKLYSLVSPLKPSQFAIEQGAKSDEQIINEIVELVFEELDKVREEGIREALKEVEKGLGISMKYENGEYKVHFRVSKLKTKEDEK